MCSAARPSRRMSSAGFARVPIDSEPHEGQQAVDQIWSVRWAAAVPGRSGIEVLGRPPHRCHAMWVATRTAQGCPGWPQAPPPPSGGVAALCTSTTSRSLSDEGRARGVSWASGLPTLGSVVVVFGGRHPT
jgi:hypothetical protein